jgi:3-oxoacyl-[acyl-carrier protein] reductase
VDISGRIAIVTGAASGIGRAVAQVLAEAGAAGIVIADVDSAGAGETRDLVEANTEAECLVVETDVASESQVEAMVEETIERFGRVDVLVNNAGICPMVPWDDTTLESWNRILEINLTGAYLCSKAVLPPMRQQKFGRIVFISSAGAFTGSVTGHVAYGASKAGMLALMKVVAKEFGTEGILANAIAPGSIDTPITNSFGEEAKKKFADLSTLKRQGTPRELADAVLFLVSDRATYVNGATLHVNAGSLLV